MGSSNRPTLVRSTLTFVAFIQQAPLQKKWVSWWPRWVREGCLGGLGEPLSPDLCDLMISCMLVRNRDVHAGVHTHACFFPYVHEHMRALGLSILCTHVPGGRGCTHIHVLPPSHVHALGLTIYVMLLPGGRGVHARVASTHDTHIHIFARFDTYSRARAHTSKHARSPSLFFPSLQLLRSLRFAML